MAHVDVLQIFQIQQDHLAGLFINTEIRPSQILLHEFCSQLQQLGSPVSCSPIAVIPFLDSIRHWYQLLHYEAVDGTIIGNKTVRKYSWYATALQMRQLSDAPEDAGDDGHHDIHYDVDSATTGGDAVVVGKVVGGSEAERGCLGTERTAKKIQTIPFLPTQKNRCFFVALCWESCLVHVGWEKCGHACGMIYLTVAVKIVVVSKKGTKV
jgi:hypothetical protein